MNEEKTPSTMCEMSEKLIGYLYQELSAEDASAFEAHVKTCARCARDLRDFGRVRRALAEWRIASAPHASVELERGAARPRFRQAVHQLLLTMPTWGRVLLGGATALLLLALFNIQVEWMPGGGFRFSASLFPSRILAPTPSSEMSSRERQQIRQLLEAVLRDTERRQQEALAVSVRELTEHLRREQRAALAEFLRDWEERQRTQWASMLNELEQRRYGALTFADLFFPGNDGN
ncbi:MAG: zf-HC2 domain-containing protein [Blastocatellia bacterium]|nr:zf-HC2 domain-containing protein [Blastocatellia bacterium]MCS7156288.1 zf-HC2 domain-containing protein [Blastocatellia bacterium]MCX7751362.1 zf-HC2 domain-containing protein [Blastocatellia bacterium]MDW8169074.1 zf-HC2 domain-containing protein [Acidobacteriota bacterium]MDW8255779.1 zf-HC2 domain-containing protein [Acidobacteriota bacterium]